MYEQIKAQLYKLEPETAHKLTLDLMRLAGAVAPVRGLLGMAFAAPAEAVEVMGLQFKNRVGLAAGYDKDGVALRGLGSLGFGHIEMGTVTSRPQAGNPTPRVFRLVKEEGVINRMGFPSLGAEFAQGRLNPNLERGMLERVSGITSRSAKKLPVYPFVLGVNIGKNKETPNEEAVLDYLSLLQNFSPYADYIAINISSPNTAGLRDLQGRQELTGLLKALNEQRRLEETTHKKRLPMAVKLAPDLSDAQLEDAVGVILEQEMDCVIATNTTLARAGAEGNPLAAEGGGLSGAPLRQLSDRQLEKTARLVNGRVPIIGVGGIMCAEDAKRKLDLGASLVQIYTGMIFKGPGLAREICRELARNE